MSRKKKARTNNDTELGLCSDVLSKKYMSCCSMSNMTSYVRFEVDKEPVFVLDHTCPGRDSSVKTVLTLDTISPIRTNFTNTFNNYIVSMHLNYFTQTPNAPVTMRMYRFKKESDLKDLLEKNTEAKYLKNKLEPLEPSFPYRMGTILPLLSDVCANSALYAFEQLFFENTQTMYRFVMNANKNDSFEYDMMCVLFQTYAFLRVYQRIFTHNSLSDKNVLLVRVPDKYFRFVYKNERGERLEFDSPYLVKVTDFRHSYMKRVTPQLHIALKKTAKCKSYAKYFIELYGEECISKIRRNVSNDLSLLYGLIDTFYFGSVRGVRDLNELINAVTFDKFFCTTEKKESGLDFDMLNNVEDAYTFLFDRMMKYDSKKQTQKREKRELYGTFEIYTGIVDSISTNSAKRNENEFKFTPA